MKVHEKGLSVSALFPWVGSQGGEHKFRVTTPSWVQFLVPWRPHLSKRARFPGSWGQAVLHTRSCQGLHVNTTGATESCRWVIAGSTFITNGVASCNARLEDRKYFYIFMNIRDTIFPYKLRPYRTICRHPKNTGPYPLTL